MVRTLVSYPPKAPSATGKAFYQRMIYGIGVGVPVEAVEEEDHSQRWEGPMHCGERKSDHVDYNLPSQTPIDSRIIHQV